MNFGKLAMKTVMASAMTLAPIIMTSNPALAQSEYSRPGAHSHRVAYHSKWCADVSFILQVSLDSAYHATTFEKERSILISAINKTLDRVNPKFHFYFETTLLLALNIERELSSEKEKVFFLRRAVLTALSDLGYFDSYSRSMDHGGYVKDILKRAIEEGVRVRTEELEILVLNASISNAISVLAESSYRRSASHACASAYLVEAQTFDDVFYKRSLVQRAIDSLSRGCHY